MSTLAHILLPTIAQTFEKIIAILAKHGGSTTEQSRKALQKLIKETPAARDANIDYMCAQAILLCRQRWRPACDAATQQHITSLTEMFGRNPFETPAELKRQAAHLNNWQPSEAVAGQALPWESGQTTPRQSPPAGEVATQRPEQQLLLSPTPPPSTATPPVVVDPTTGKPKKRAGTGGKRGAKRVKTVT